MLVCKVKIENEEYWKLSFFQKPTDQKSNLRISPTTLQPRVILPIAHYWVEMMHPDSLR